MAAEGGDGPPEHPAAAQPQAPPLCGPQSAAVIWFWLPSRRLWHLILTGQGIVNTPQAECMCQLYGLCLPN